MKNNSQLSVDSKRSIKRLSKKAWQGTDANLETSLFEYDMVWKEKKDEFQFIHKCSHGEGYTSSWFKKNINFKREFNWVDWDKFLLFAGFIEFKYWNELPFGQKIHDLVSFYGMENIFGGDYHEGFDVKFI